MYFVNIDVKIMVNSEQYLFITWLVELSRLIECTPG